MIVMIESAVPAEDVRQLRDDLSRLDFAPGASTAGWAARLVKHNAQAAPDPCADSWRERLAAALMSHPIFALAAHPNRIIGPMFSRYRPGDHYGTHVDEPIIDGSRTDLSFTLFLDEPESYKGGELVIETSAGEDVYKLTPGVLCSIRRPPCTEWRR